MGGFPARLPLAFELAGVRGGFPHVPVSLVSSSERFLLWSANALKVRSRVVFPRTATITQKTDSRKTRIL